MLYHLPHKKEMSLEKVIVAVTVFVILLLVVFPLLEKPARSLSSVGGWWKYTSDTVLPVRIVSLPNPGNFNTMIVTIDEPVNVGTTIFTQDHELVGSLTKVLSRNQAELQLLSTGGNQIMVKLSSKTDVMQVTATGRGNGTYVIEVPHGADIELGTTVYTSSGNHVIGKVAFIKEQKQDPYKRVFVSLSHGIQAQSGFLVGQ